MSFWNNPGASFEGLINDPWHSMENFGTTGLVPLIPYVGGIVGGIYGGPAGAAAGGAIGQEGVDYFGGNSQARTGKGIFGSLTGGAGKGSLANGGYNYGMGGFDSLGNLFGSGDTTSSVIPTDGNIGDVFGGWSPTGSDAGYSSSQLNPSGYGDGWSSAGFNGGDSGPSGSSSSNGYNLKDLNNPATRSLLGNLLKGQQGTSQQNANAYNSYKPMNIARQPDFLPTSPAINVQDKSTDLAALIKALRG